MEEENIIYKIEILQLVEKFYGVEIKDEDIENILTIQDLIKTIRDKIVIS